MEQLIIGISIFFISVLIIELIIYSIKNSRSPDRIKVRKRLKKFTYVDERNEDSDIMRKRVLSDIPLLNMLLYKIPGILKVDNLIMQANARYSIGFYISTALLLSSLGLIFATLIMKNRIYALAFMPLFGSMPFFYLHILKQKRMELMRKQLPEALDLIARALKAGHAFTGAMRLAGDEFDDPLGPEFAETMDEINFGVSVPVALKHLAERIDCAEIRYFVVAVVLQRETGGNLAELMETLSGLIRQRFVFDGKVKTLSAEGKLSAVVLICLPFGMIGYLKLTQPNYMNLLFTDSIGRIMGTVAVIMMVIGFIVIKKMIKIEV